jgi:GST-like protein
MNDIELYYWSTPNGQKIVIALEELGLPYKLIPINIFNGDQFDPEFLKISPNNKIPALTWVENGKRKTLFESGAILLHIAEVTKALMSEENRLETLQWLFWQMGGLGPMAGQNHHFSGYAKETIPYAVNRYRDETKRLYGVLDKQLEGRDFITGEYGIADIASYPWIDRYKLQGITLSDFPNVSRWYSNISKRPAVIKTYEISANIAKSESFTTKSREVLFGQVDDAESKNINKELVLEILEKAKYEFRHRKNNEALRVSAGDHFGMKNLGINLTHIPAGSVSALAHYHSHDDEWIYVLEGSPTLYTDKGESDLNPGMCVGYPGGVKNAHRLVNNTDQTVILLEVSTRIEGDKAAYPHASEAELKEVFGE